MECPEPMERGRNFRLLAEDELPSLLDFLAGYLPESLKFHQTLLTYMRDRVWDFHFYVANDWPDSPICLHFPGMTLSPHGLISESVAVFCPNDRLELLKLVREEDALIDWSKPLYINFVHHDIAQELVRLYEGTGHIERVVGDVCVCQNLEAIDSVEESDKDADPDIRVLPLKPEHAEGIHELYPANDMECQEVFLRLIRTLPAAGVFAKGSLAAWMVQSYYGAMFSMQTKPEYRRKGYGTKLARYLTKRVADKGYQPFVVILPENDASQSLYKKLGFVKLYQTVRMTFMPYAWQEEETETSRVLRENLENAVRQLAIEHHVVDAFRNGEAGVTDKGDVPDSPSKVENSDAIAAEEPEDVENPPEEETIDPVENNAGETVDDAARAAAEDGTADNADETGNEDGGGTDVGDAE